MDAEFADGAVRTRLDTRLDIRDRSDDDDLRVAVDWSTTAIEGRSGVSRRLENVLDESDVSHFAASGWMARRGFFSDAEARRLGAWTDELLASPEVVDGPMLYREASLTADGTRIVQRIENFCPYHAAFDDLIRRGSLIKTVEALFGCPAVLFKEKINFKMPGGSGFELHQDQQAGWSTYAPLFITAMVTIDPATLKNGCLEIARMPRQTTLLGKEWAPLTPDDLGDARMQPIPTRPGDVLFFDSYVSHASKPNNTSSARRILYLTFNRASDGDHRARYYADKRASFPPDIERKPGVDYKFRV